MQGTRWLNTILRRGMHSAKKSESYWGFLVPVHYLCGCDAMWRHMQCAPQPIFPCLSRPYNVFSKSAKEPLSVVAMPRAQFFHGCPTCRCYKGQKGVTKVNKVKTHIMVYLRYLKFCKTFVTFWHNLPFTLPQLQLCAPLI